MILTQNSLVVNTTELDALEAGTFKDTKEIVLCGSSWCRSKTSLAKLKTNFVSAKEATAYLQANEAQAEKTPSLSAVDMPEFDHFERKIALKMCGRGKHSMSQRTKTKIRQKITAWSQTPRKKDCPKFTFITLTLTSTQIGNDKEYASMLNTFFTYLRKFYPFKNYLYVNERQGNGNIHSHIITDILLPISKINYIWCKILKSRGYTFTPKGQSVAIVDFKSGKGGANPVDVRPVYDLKKVSSYITKYITKNESEFDCLIWNCSQSISHLFTSAKISRNEIFSTLFDGFVKVLNVKLDNGLGLHIHLLKHYTGIQKKTFKINERVLSETIDKEGFLKLCGYQSKQEKLLNKVCI